MINEDRGGAVCIAEPPVYPTGIETQVVQVVPPGLIDTSSEIYGSIENLFQQDPATIAAELEPYRHVPEIGALLKRIYSEVLGLEVDWKPVKRRVYRGFVPASTSAERLAEVYQALGIYQAEANVVGLLMGALENKQIAKKRVKSKRTVEFQIARLSEKLGVGNRVGIVMRVIDELEKIRCIRYFISRDYGIQ